VSDGSIQSLLACLGNGEFLSAHLVYFTFSYDTSYFDFMSKYF
jgi:hypothetical protein